MSVPHHEEESRAKPLEVCFSPLNVDARVEGEGWMTRARFLSDFVAHVLLFLVWQ